MSIAPRLNDRLPKMEGLAHECDEAFLCMPPPRHQTALLGLGFGDVVLWPKRHRAQRAWVRVRRGAKVHGHAKEAGHPIRFCAGLHFLEMSPQGLLAFVDAENRLKNGACGGG